MAEFEIEKDGEQEYCRVLGVYRGWDDCETCGGLPNELIVDWYSEDGYDIRETYGCYGGTSSYCMTADEAKLWVFGNLDKEDAVLAVQSIARFEDRRRQSESPSASVGSDGEA